MVGARSSISKRVFAGGKGETASPLEELHTAGIGIIEPHTSALESPLLVSPICLRQKPTLFVVILPFIKKGEF